MKENVDNKNIRQFKKNDHIYRKIREEENKVIEKNINSQELNVKSIIENIQEEHSRVIELKHQLLQANDFKVSFFDKLYKEKTKVYE